jgi:RecA-family ATPase
VEQSFPPLEPLVTYNDRAVLHEGMSLLAAKPKMGKSMLALNIALAVSSGGTALGYGEAREGSVLYLDLDGSERDAQERLKAMCPASSLPTALHIAHPDGHVPKLNEEGHDHLKYFAERYDLIVVDTVKRLRPRTDGERSAYDTDYEFLHPIARIGRQHDASILAIHHLNKAQRGDPLDKVSGSTGLTAAPETVMVLEGDRESEEAELVVQSRRGPDDRFHLEFDERLLTWRLGGIPTPGTDRRQEVWAKLKGADGWIHYTELAERLDVDACTANQHLNKLKYEDRMPIEDNDGEYRAA